MRLEYYILVDSPYLSGLLTLEVILTIINLIGYIPVIYVVQTAPFHRNLKILMTTIIVYFYFGMAARLTTIEGILGVISVNSEDPTSDPLMVAASFIRMFFFAIFSFSISSLYFERRLATIFIEDYERKQRLYVALLISFYMTIGSLISSFLIVFEYIDWIILVGVTVIQSAWIAYRFWWLERLNKKKLKKLSSGITRVRYSLSIRFQLNENLRIMRLMRCVFIMIIAVNLFSCGVYMTANLASIRMGNPVVWQVLDTVFNIIVNIDGYLVPLIILLVDDTYKKILKESPLLSWVVCCYTPASDEPPLEKHGTIYFSSLQIQWENTNGEKPPLRKHLSSTFQTK